MKAAAGGVIAVLLVPVLFLGVLASGGASPIPGLTAMATGVATVPSEMWGLYVEAGSRFGVQPALVAAVGKVECDHNRDPKCAVPNAAGAVGPMQFLPSTFVAWSWASGNPVPSITDPRDAVFAAAAKLAADGAATDPSKALWSYNHSSKYVAVVQAWAVAYGWTAPHAGVLAQAVQNHPNIGLRPAAKRDVASGLVDARVLALLLVLATGAELGHVGPFVSGHSYYVSGTNSPSNHAFGRAVDIPVVNGAPVSPGNAGAQAATEMVMRMPKSIRPTEVGAPWLISASDGHRTFTADHHDHLHFGWDS